MENKTHDLRKHTGFPIQFLKNTNKDGTRTITGCNPDVGMNVGDIIIPVTKEVGVFTIKTIERRNVVGNYSDKVNKKDAFFKAVCDYTPSK